MAPEQLKVTHPDLTLKEYGAHFGVSDRAVRKALKKLNFSFKRIILYHERDEANRAAYSEKLETIAAEKVFYLDEYGITNQLIQEKCWSPKGETVISERSGKRSKRINFFAGSRVNLK